MREHLLGAEAVLDGASIEHLGASQRDRRAAMREELARYRAAGRFPKNHDFPSDRRPYFIDAHGTRCAMAHLMEAGGAAQLVAEVARANNNAYVAELAGDPRFVAWLEEHGLTVEEAARIQPSYDLAAALCICMAATGDGTPGSAQRGALEATVMTADAGASSAHVQVEALHGNTGALSVGDQLDVLVARHGALNVGDRVLVQAGDPDAGIDHNVLATLDANDIVGPVCERYRPDNFYYRLLGILSKSETLALLDQSNGACSQALAAMDACWTKTFYDCTYAPRLGQPARFSGGVGPDPYADAGTDASAQDAGDDAGAVGDDEDAATAPSDDAGQPLEPAPDVDDDIPEQSAPFQDAGFHSLPRGCGSGCQSGTTRNDVGSAVGPAVAVALAFGWRMRRRRRGEGLSGRERG